VIPPGDRRSGTLPDRLLVRLALASTFLLSIAACFRRVWGVDFWWQYRTGRYVVEHGWPSVDVFSYTVAGEPWIELRWLYCLAQYVIVERLGVEALVALKWLAILAAFALVTVPVLRARPLPATSLVLSVAILATSQRFFVRPELVTYVLFGLFVLIVRRYRSNRTRWIWALPVLQILWVNSHTLFVLGPLLVGLLLFVTAAGAWFSRSERGIEDVGPAQLGLLSGVLGATMLACLVNPYGWEGVVFPFRLFGQIRGDSVFNQVIEEFRGPFLVGFSFTAVRYYTVLIALAAVSVGINWRRLDPFWTLLCASQFYLSLLAVRNIPLFALAAVPFILDNLARSDGWAARESRWRVPASRLACVVTIVGCGWYSLGLATDRFNLHQNDSNQFGAGLATHRYPRGAVDYLERAGIDGRILSTMGEAAYLLARDRPVFIDPRLEVYGETWLRRYLALQQDPAAFAAAVREFDIRVLLVPLRSNLIRAALVQPEWSLVYFDEVAAVFVRGDALGSTETIDTAEAWELALARVRLALGRPRAYEQLGPFERVSLPGPYLAVADFLLMAFRPDAAESWVEDAARAWPDSDGLALRRVAIAELRGEWDAVVAEAESGLRRAPDDVRLQFKLGNALARLERLDEAATWLRRGLEQRPDRAKSWALLGSIHARQEALVEAESCFARAGELAPLDAGHLSNLARVRARLGRTDQAIAGLEQALALAPADVTVIRDLALMHVKAGDSAAAMRYVSLGLRLAPAEPTLVGIREHLRREK